MAIAAGIAIPLADVLNRYPRSDAAASSTVAGSLVLGGVAACRLGAMNAGSLGLSVEEFRVLAGRVVEEAAGYLDRLDRVPIRPGSTGAQTLQLFAGPPPETGLGAAALDDLGAVAVHSRAGNGRFFGYVMGSAEPVGAIADFSRP